MHVNEKIVHYNKNDIKFEIILYFLGMHELDRPKGRCPSTRWAFSNLHWNELKVIFIFIYSQLIRK